MSKRRTYPSDLTDEQWRAIRPLLPKRKTKAGHPVVVSRKDLVDAILYILATGCQWRSLPHDFPPRSTVFFSDRDVAWQGPTPYRGFAYLPLMLAHRTGHVLDARDPAQAITEQAEKLFVIKGGRIVARNTRTSELVTRP